MSRIGKQPIIILEKVDVKIEGNLVTVKGPKGELNRSLPFPVKARVEDGKIFIEIEGEENLSEKKNMALWGLSRALVFNMVKGAQEGYEKKLEIQGIGYRAAMQGSGLVLSLGHSHQIEFEAPKGIEFKIVKNTISVSGADKELVGETAARLRQLRKPEPYKGKGIRYEGEVIKIKAGKKAVSAGGA